MINKIEAIGIFVCVGFMALALFLMRMETTPDILSMVSTQSQTATVVTNSDSLASTVKESVDMKGNVNTLIVDDVIVGEGKEVVATDTVVVHYIGTLQNGQQFDNSYTKGEPFSFTVGEGEVIKGWEQGLLGMKVGGQRILVIPADLAYGATAVGPIPANSTLVFAIELIEIQ